MIRRINLFAGPGAGKSTAAAAIYSDLKRRGYSVELINEYIKGWAYEAREVKPYDQLYVFAKQLRKEELVLRNGVDLIVTDSPILLSISYARKYGFKDWKALLDVACGFEKEYPSLNIYLDRGDCPYQEDGRWETRKQAVEMDRQIKELMEEWLNNWTESPYDAHAALVEIVEEKIDEQETVGA